MKKSNHKSGRPGIPYQSFVEVWEQLLNEGRAGTNAAHAILGGSKSTIASYREQYEREKSETALSVIKHVELTEAVQRAIAEIKVKEITELEKSNTQLKSRIDNHLATLKETEANLADARVNLSDAKANFDIEKLELERQLAAAQARIDDAEKREQKLINQHEQLNEKYNQAKQAAAVAEKEIEMLRELREQGGEK